MAKSPTSGAASIDIEKAAPAAVVTGAPGSDPAAERADVAAAAAGVLAAGRPEDAARAAAAAAGSSVDAPGVGSGPIGEQSMQAQPLFRPAFLGAVSEPIAEERDREWASRLASLAEQVRLAPITGAKLAVPLPDDAEVLDIYREAGFDLVIVSRRDHFARAGVFHPSVATMRRSGDFTSHELQALTNEPMLVLQALR